MMYLLLFIKFDFAFLNLKLKFNDMSQSSEKLGNEFRDLSCSNCIL